LSSWGGWLSFDGAGCFLWCGLGDDGVVGMCG